MSHLARAGPSRLAAPMLIPRASTSRSFSSSRQSQASPKGAKKGVVAAPVGKKKQNVGFTKGSEKAKALMKPVVLTFANPASEPDLSTLLRLHPEVFLPANVGRATTFPYSTFQQLQTLGLPRRIGTELSQAGSPASVIRQSTIDLVNLLKDAKPDPNTKRRYILTGPGGSGKSMLLLQAITYALQSGWIVLSTPRADRWIDSSSSFSYHASSQIFHQGTLAADMLEVMLKVNQDKLSGITLSKTAQTDDGESFAAGTTLVQVAQRGLKAGVSSVGVLNVVLNTLAAQTKTPVLWAIDDVQSLFQISQYRKPDYTFIEPYHLSMPSLALSFLTGHSGFTNGLVLSAMSHTTPNIPPSSAFLTGLELPTTRPISPYKPVNAYHLANASSGMEKIDVPFGMSPVEAAGMFEIWARKGWASKAADEAFMMALQSSEGNPREFGRGLTMDFRSV